MSYFRNLFAECKVRKPATKCLGCGCGVYKFERFCIFCKTPNPKFSKETFEGAAKLTLNEALAGCKRGITHAVESMEYVRYKERRPKRLPPPKYCGICGAEIPPLE